MAAERTAVDPRVLQASALDVQLAPQLVPHAADAPRSAAVDPHDEPSLPADIPEGQADSAEYHDVVGQSGTCVAVEDLPTAENRRERQADMRRATKAAHAYQPAHLTGPALLNSTSFALGSRPQGLNAQIHSSGRLAHHSQHGTVATRAHVARSSGIECA